MRNRETEVLAPAGSYECLEAAVQAGADAVYLGGRQFGARAFAANFDREDLLRALEYVHLRGRKLYLTVNTLLKDRETEELEEYLMPFYREGLDAVIVQDLGVLDLVRERFPDLAVHISTQMTVTSEAGARFFKDRGATRIVPARELSLEEIRKMEPDVIVVVAFGQIIPKEILDMPKYGCINVHASLLPAYRGAAPIQWAVMNGDEVSGVTIMKMDEGLDTGDMLTKVEVPLAADETGGSLFDKLAAAGAKLLVETLPKLEKGEVTPEKQPEISTTEYARMIKKEDGKIDWTKSAVEIERQIRAMSPWPSAFTKVNGKNLKIWDAKVIAMFGGDLFSKIPGQNPTKSAGKVWVADETGLHVKTGDGILVIEELQLEGKKRMKTADFLRGYAIEPGTRLGE